MKTHWSNHMQGSVGSKRLLWVWTSYEEGMNKSLPGAALEKLYYSCAKTAAQGYQNQRHFLYNTLLRRTNMVTVTSRDKKTHGHI